ncbi:hypothetical protein GJAV_G00234000 [Gymnothorax javanicus]|nr:hypothetical protein GJAV_G00234000 [Gymnothorax javanicus]
MGRGTGHFLSLRLNLVAEGTGLSQSVTRAPSHLPLHGGGERPVTFYCISTCVQEGQLQRAVGLFGFIRAVGLQEEDLARRPLGLDSTLPLARPTNSANVLLFTYAAEGRPQHCVIMRRWVLESKLPSFLSGLCLHVVFLLSGVLLSQGDRTPEELAAIMNCSKQDRNGRSYDHMEGGDVRVRQLFSRTQWFLTIDDDGIINGTQDPTNCYSILEIRTVSEGGVLAIKGIKSQFYISMNETGILQAKKSYSESCNFKEVFLENYFNAYSSAKWTKPNGKEMFISLSQKGRPLRGKRTRKENMSCHFIPLKCKPEERRVE